jgi:hemolysin activation/secretion protein
VLLGTSHLAGTVPTVSLHFDTSANEGKPLTAHLFYLMIMLLISCALISEVRAAELVVQAGFEIKAFDVTGNSIFSFDKVQDAVAPFTGSGRTEADVEKARSALENLYHSAGYPAVTVNIPEQTLKDGVVKLQVIENRIGRVKITGNRYFTREKVMKDLPSLAPGEILYLPKVQEEIGRLNRNQDIKVEPAISLGAELGTIDVELKVQDQLPVHGYLELNNRASPDTTELRLNAMIRYDNLWQKEHSLALQYQMSPQDPSQVEVGGVSYVLPTPWQQDHQLAFFAIWSDSKTGFGEGFEVVGKGQIVGMRYAIPLPPYKLYNHNFTLGIDYKHFNESEGYTTPGGQTTETPISYLPLSFSYNASLPDEWGGTTQFNVGLNMSFRGLVSDETEFELKRYMATANYLYATMGIQRAQKLPWGMSLSAKVDGQLSDEPLIDNEQYVAGGMENVRGYRESEAEGDNALHSMVELSFANPFEKSKIGQWLQMRPFIFHDIAVLSIRDPLPAQSRGIKLEGVGAGLRGTMKRLEYELDWAVALNSTSNTQSGDQRVYFKVRAVF